MAMQVADTTIEELQQQLAEQHAAVTAQQAEADNLRQCLSDSKADHVALQGQLATDLVDHTAAAQVDKPFSGHVCWI